jgi:hypothetical protein
MHPLRTTEGTALPIGWSTSKGMEITDRHVAPCNHRAKTLAGIWMRKHRVRVQACPYKRRQTVQAGKTHSNLHTRVFSYPLFKPLTLLPAHPIGPRAAHTRSLVSPACRLDVAAE